MKIGMHILLWMHVVCLQTHLYLKGNVQEAWAHAFSLLELQLFQFTGYALLYNTVTCTLHVYKPTVWPVASHRLLFDIQVVKFLFGEYTLF